MIKQELYGKTKDGEEVTLYRLKNKNGMEADFIDFGANLVNLYVPDKNGKITDVVLGYDNLEGYLVNPPSMGSFVGRNANRIAGAQVILNNKTYELEKNNGENNLHSSSVGYNKHMYETEIFEEEDSISIEFSRLSPDMEQGFPGNLDLTVTYTLTDENELVIEYLAVSDKDTVVNFTNHSYFNLAGHNSGLVLDHKVYINADRFTITNDDMIPTGELVDVTGTPMDFRTLKSIGQDFNADYKPLIQGNGYDHNYVLNTAGEDVGKVAELFEEKSGRLMEVFTDLPGLQFYTSNFLETYPGLKNKDGATYTKRSGVCFETQLFPNACNNSNFRSSVLKAGQEYDFVTVYKFSTK